MVILFIQQGRDSYRHFRKLEMICLSSEMLSSFPNGTELMYSRIKIWGCLTVDSKVFPPHGLYHTFHYTLIKLHLWTALKIHARPPPHPTARWYKIVNTITCMLCLFCVCEAPGQVRVEYCGFMCVFNLIISGFFQAIRQHRLIPCRWDKCRVEWTCFKYLAST